MIRRPPRSTLDRSSAASDVYKRQALEIFKEVDSNLSVEVLIIDGTQVKPGDIVLTVSGSDRSILKAERLVLNCMQRMSGIATVSYTHLRAHETVLDLVCRLLLEKKKYTKKKI